MPIRFVCSNCQQRLSVPERKAGSDVKCPRCRHVVTAPTRESATARENVVTPPPPSGPSPRANADEPLGLPEFSVEDQAEELIYAPDANPSPDHGGDSNVVMLPRRVVYLQGFLLGAVALTFFVFGLIVGSRSVDNTNMAGKGPPCTVSGRVMFQNETRQALPDEGSVVLLVPVSIRPDTKIPPSGLRPDDPAPATDHPGVAGIRSLGGECTRVNRQGKFRLRVPKANRYYLLLVSRHALRSDREQPTASDLAQLGRYFLPATQLLGKHKYAWREIVLRDDRQFNITF